MGLPFHIRIAQQGKYAYYNIMRAQIEGQLIDDQSRCVHWHSELDVIAIRFKCCDKYYACYSCHNSLEDHTIEKFSLTKDALEPLILCGICKQKMSFDEYQGAFSGWDSCNDLRCPFCTAKFNPGCKFHYDIYFDK